MDLLLKKEDIDLRLIDVLALYYGQGVVGLKDKLIRKLFSNTSEPSLQERFIRRIGIILSDRENGVISEDVVKRLVDLWGYRKKGLEGIENAHQKELAQFSLWYKSGKFDREWALQQLHYVVVKCEAEVSVWDVLEGLEQDVVISVEQVLEILYSLAKKDENIFEIKDKRTIENILSYINNEANEFLQKGQEFVNKFLCTRVYDFNYWTNALRDYKNN